MMALTVVLSVMSGFELDLKHKILGTNAHAVVLKYGNDFREYPEVAQEGAGGAGRDRRDAVHAQRGDGQLGEQPLRRGA